MNRRTRAVVFLAAIMVAAGLSSCTSPDDNDVANPPVSTEVAERTAPLSAATTTDEKATTTTAASVSAAAVNLVGPGTVCDPNPQRKVVVNRGAVDCAQAIRIIEVTPGMGVQAPPDIEGWTCGRVGGAGAMVSTGYSYRCDRGSDQVIQQDSTVPTAANWDLTSFYNSSRNGHYFTTPSGKFGCAILGNSAGCHGPLPKDVPVVRSTAGTGMVPPNTINTVNGGTGALLSRGDPQYQLVASDGTAKALAYGDTLFANGISCGIDADTGVTCTNFATGHGFTVSDTAVRLF